MNMNMDNVNELLNIYSKNPDTIKTNKIKNILGEISNQQFQSAMNSSEYTDEQKNIIKNLYNQKKFLITSTTSQLSNANKQLLQQLLQNSSQDSGQIGILFNKLREIVLNINGDNKDSNLIIAAIIKLLLNDITDIKIKQKEIVTLLQQIYNKKI